MGLKNFFTCTIHEGVEEVRPYLGANWMNRPQKQFEKESQTNFTLYGKANVFTQTPKGLPCARMRAE